MLGILLIASKGKENFKNFMTSKADDFEIKHFVAAFKFFTRTNILLHQQQKHYKFARLFCDCDVHFL